jgi:hypothetical protein
VPTSDATVLVYRARRFIALLLAASYDFDRGHLANVERTIRRPIKPEAK